MAATSKQNVYRVLIVDEDAGVREMLAELLRAPNRSVEIRDSVRTALEFLQHNPVDIAFIDAMLAGTASQDLADTIRKRCPHAHVVVCAGRLSQPFDAAGRIKKGDRDLQSTHFGDVLELADSCTTE